MSVLSRAPRPLVRLHLALLAVALAACAHVPTQKEIEAAEIHYDLGVNAVTGNRSQEALREFMEAARLNPEMPEVHNAIGLLHHWSYRSLDQAKVEFEKAVALRPSYPEAWNNLGALLAEQGNLAGAHQAFDHALIDPLYKTPYIAQTNLGWVMHLEGHSAMGKDMTAAALHVHPDYCMGHRTMARILDAEKRFGDADASWLLFARHCPDEPEAMYRGALAQARHGEETAASRSLLRCIEKAEGRPIATECRAALARLPALPAEALIDPLRPNPTDPGQSVRGSHDLETPR